jgi:hypothetical protein
MQHIKVVGSERTELNDRYGYIEFEYNSDPREARIYSACIMTGGNLTIAVVSVGEFIKVSEEEYQTALIMDT